MFSKPIVTTGALTSFIATTNAAITGKIAMSGSAFSGNSD